MIGFNFKSMYIFIIAPKVSVSSVDSPTATDVHALVFTHALAGTYALASVSVLVGSSIAGVVAL
jgi:hypothetical protein